MPSAIIQRIECNLPIVARPSEDDCWYASLDVPRELATLQADTRLNVLDTISASLGERRRLNQQTESVDGITRQPWVIVNCSLWLRRATTNEWRTSVNFSWPDVWADFTRTGREGVLAAIADALDETRQLIRAQSRREA